MCDWSPLVLRDSVWSALASFRFQRTVPRWPCRFLPGLEVLVQVRISNILRNHSNAFLEIRPCISPLGCKCSRLHRFLQARPRLQRKKRARKMEFVLGVGHIMSFL